MNAVDLMLLNDRLKIHPSETNTKAGSTHMEADTVRYCNGCPMIDSVGDTGDTLFCSAGHWQSTPYKPGTDRILRPDSCQARPDRIRGQVKDMETGKVKVSPVVAN